MSKVALKEIVATALVNGATRVSNEVNVAVSGVNQSPQILLGKITTILRSEAIAVGQEMMNNGLESISGDKPPGLLSW
jgi:hypothetical protein